MTKLTPRPIPAAWIPALDAFAEALRAGGASEQTQATRMQHLRHAARALRAEVARVHSRDLVDDLDGASLVVTGKGGKQRVVPLTATLAAELRARPRGYAFPGSDDGHLSPRWVGKIVAELLPGTATMHQLRHRFATRAYAVDRDVLTVQQLLGHASPATTQRYVVVPPEAGRRTVLAAAG